MSLKDMGPWSFATAAVVLAAMVVMAALHVDTRTLIDVILVLGLGAGVQAIGGLRGNVNGNVTRLMNLLEKAIDVMSKSPPVIEGTSVESTIEESKDGP